MKTLPPYWKVKASPIVREFMLAQREWNANWKWYSPNDKYKYNGWNRDELYPDLPTLTQAQFKRLVYDPWKSQQFTTEVFTMPMQVAATPPDGMDAEVWQEGDMIKAKSVPRKRPNPKRILLSKHNRITAELQRQCEQMQEEIQQHKQDKEKCLQEVRLLRMENEAQEARTYQLEAERQNLTDEVESLKRDISTRTKVYENQLAEENKRTAWYQFTTWAAALLGLVAAWLVWVGR